MPGVRVSNKFWGKTTIKQLSPTIISTGSVQNTSESSGWRISIHNSSSYPHSLFEGYSGEFFSPYYIPGLLLGSLIQCPLKIGLLQNWPLCWWNSCKETEESRKIKDNNDATTWKLSFTGHTQRGGPTVIVCSWAGNKEPDGFVHSLISLRMENTSI